MVYGRNDEVAPEVREVRGGEWRCFRKVNDLDFPLTIATDNKYSNLFCFDIPRRNKLVCMFVFIIKNG